MTGLAPIVFLLGPSGVGKTTLGNAVETHCGLLHILFDDPHGGDGVDLSNLRVEWNAFLKQRNPRPLADELRKRIAISGHTGVVISCPSGVMPAEDGQAAEWHFPRSFLIQMNVYGVRSVTLFGPLDVCRAAAMSRVDGRTVTADSWHESNLNWHSFRPWAFSDQVLEPFCGSIRRDMAALVLEFERRFLSEATLAS